MFQQLRLSLLLLFVALAPFSAAQNPTDPPLPAATTQQLQAILDCYANNGYTPGVIYAISKPGFQTWYGAAGIASTTQMMEAIDSVRIGSLTKTFTATLILRLIADGSYGFTLDSTLASVLPDQAALLSTYATSDITVKMLLQHTSGIYNYVEDCVFQNHYKNDPINCPYGLEDYLKIANNHPPTFAPGTSWSYSNTNYVLLGMLAEKVTNKPYHQLIDEMMADPAVNLPNTYAPPPGEYALPAESSDGFINWAEYDASFAPCYFTGPAANTLVDQSLIVPEYAWSAGDIVSKSMDLATWIRLVGQGSLLPKPLYVEQITPYNTGEGYGYGLGLQILYDFFNYDETIFGHQGQITGWDTFAGYIPRVGPNRSGLVVVQLLNKTFPVQGADTVIYQKVLDVLLGRKTFTCPSTP